MLLKINKVIDIATLFKTVVIRISKLNLEHSILLSNININNWRNKHWTGVFFYTRNNLSYDVKSFLLLKREKIFFELLLPSTKQIVFTTIYRPQNEPGFLEMTNTHINTLSTNNDKIHIFNAFTIYFYLNNSYLFQNNNLLQRQLISCDIKNSMNFVQLP